MKKLIKMRRSILLSTLFAGMSLFVSCERPIIEIDGDEKNAGEYLLTFNINKFETTAFDEPQQTSRSSKAVSEVCTRINFAVYDADTVRVKSINQQYKSTDDDDTFGTVSVSLPAGEYTICALAHSGEGNATTTNPTKITFTNNKISDTFSYFEKINVSDDTNMNVEMKRIVARFRLVITDEVPSNVKSFKFYYTGGSSTYSAYDNVGVVNSKQTEIRDVNADGIYDIYTFPKADSDVLKITVTALDESGNEVAEKVFENVPITVNKTTKYTGKFFGDSRSGSFSFTVDDSWDGEESYNY